MTTPMMVAASDLQALELRRFPSSELPLADNLQVRQQAYLAAIPPAPTWTCANMDDHR
jgi:hypothetical protein